MPTFGEALQAGMAALAPVLSRSTAQRDAELLLLHVTGGTRTELLAHPEKRLTPEQSAAYDAVLARRAQAEPVQYITGTQEFYGLPFHVTPAVLIPRPETEHVIEAALKMASGTAARIADVGTGSGVLAITLARLLPKAAITATDISSEALAVAKENAERLGVGSRIGFVRTDLMSGIPVGERFELIVSNPPYIAEGEPLEAQVARYEPHLALFAGADGLAVYRRLIPEAAARLSPSGWLVLEIGQGQAEPVWALCERAGLRVGEVRPDLQGIARVVSAQSARG